MFVNDEIKYFSNEFFAIQMIYLLVIYNPFQMNFYEVAMFVIK